MTGSGEMIAAIAAKSFITTLNVAGLGSCRVDPAVASAPLAIDAATAADTISSYADFAVDLLTLTLALVSAFFLAVLAALTFLLMATSIFGHSSDLWYSLHVGCMHWTWVRVESAPVFFFSCGHW